MNWIPSKRQLIFFLLSIAVSLWMILPSNDMMFSQPDTREGDRIPPTLFGMHMHSAHNKTPWPAVPLATWRLWDAGVSWPDLEPRPGEWNFEILDRYVELAAQHQVEILLPLGLTPRWASARPTESSAYSPLVGDDGRAAEPKNIEDWRNYVRTVATRYKGKIRNYEIWNEPNATGFYSGTVDQMVALAREAYQILKQVDSSITVVTPAATGGDTGPDWVDGTSWLDEFFSKGGGAYGDAIGYHFYVIPQPPEAMSPLIERVKGVMAQHGLSQKPLWNTESGWFYPKIITDEQEAAAYVARSYLLNWAGGVSRLYWYSWDGASNGILRMIDPDDRTELKPAAIAYAELQKWLVGARMNGCSENKNGWTCPLIRQGGDRAWIVWNPYGNLFFEVPQNWNVQQVRDLRGDTRKLTESAIAIGKLPLLLEQ